MLADFVALRADLQGVATVKLWRQLSTVFVWMMLAKLLRRLGVHDATYNDEYYENDVEGPAAFAAPHIARSVVACFRPNSLIDIGCGTGAMLAQFRELGVKVSGLEYSSAGIRRCRQRGLDVMKFNIERDKPPSVHADLALSLEVAEHLPEWASERFVKLLCQTSPIVIVSAAQPGQPGTDHVNLQPKTYWIAKFSSICGRSYNASVRERLAEEWRKAGVAGFYWDNLMVFGPG